MHLKYKISHLYSGKLTETIYTAAIEYKQKMRICANWFSPYTCTTIHSVFSNALQNVLDEQFNPDTPNTVWVSDNAYIWTFEAVHVMDAVKKAVFRVAG